MLIKSISYHIDKQAGVKKMRRLSVVRGHAVNDKRRIRIHSYVG